MKAKLSVIISYTHAVITVCLGIFFIIKGCEKFGESKLRLKNITIENKELIVQKIVEEQNYEV